MQLTQIINNYLDEAHSNLNENKRATYEGLLLDFQSYFTEWQNNQEAADANSIKPPKTPMVYHAGEPVKLIILNNNIEAVVVEDVQQHAWATRFKTWVKVCYIDEDGIYRINSVPSALLMKFPTN